MSWNLMMAQHDWSADNWPEHVGGSFKAIRKSMAEKHFKES